MKEPRRLIDSRGPAAELLAEARRESIPSATRQRVVVAAVSALAMGAKASSAAAALSGVARVAVWKWLALGVAGAGAVVAVRAVTVPAVRALPAASAPAPTAAARPTPPVTHGNFVAIPPPPESVAPAPLPAPAPSLRVASSATGARPVAPDPVAASPKNEAPPHSASSPAPRSSLAVEIDALDSIKTALSEGDASEALRQVDAYRAAFPGGTMSAEASALRVEALVRAGRRAEAREELGRLKAAHPESPMLHTLRQLVGD